MKLNRKWLHEEFVDLSHVSDREYVEKLTVFGQKVETWERMDAEIKNVVVGKVLDIVRHENSDHMWVCQIDVGEEEPVQIVTGAQNVKVGDMVPVAKHNSWLPGGVHITKGKLRGVKSNGMLCGLEELGLSQGDFPYAITDGISSSKSPAPSDRTSTKLSATTTPLSSLKSPTTAPTATASSAWPGNPPPPSV